METNQFSEPTRQSSKGILIIFALKTFKFFKSFFLLFLAFGVSFSRSKYFENLSLSLVVLIGFGILVYLLVVAFLNYWNFKFYLKDDDFYLTTGILNKESTVISKSKIQNVYIKQNFLQQLIDVVSLNIETAGDTDSEIEIRALGKSVALQLKAELFTKSSNTPLQNETLENKKVFCRVAPKRLLLEGISQNHLRNFLIIVSFVYGLYYEFTSYISNLEFESRLEELINFKDDIASNFVIQYFVFIVFGILVTLVFSVIKTFVIHFNLEVVEHQKTIEINKGLFNKVSLSLVPNRIQNIVIKTNRFKQYLNLHTVSVKQAMVHKKQRDNFVIIALEKNQVNQLLDKLLLNYSTPSATFKPHAYYKRILAFRIFIPIPIINMLGYLMFGSAFLWFNIILVVTAMLYVYFAYKKAYYSIDDNFVTIGGGVIDTVTSILEIHKIQAVELKQTIFQKRHHITSVYIFTASKTLKIPYILEKEAKAIHDFLLFKVESQAKDWM
ncbi:hypothetical protein FEZ18_01110 [Oceanihabitans sp. IOP_32]|uniref:PH domain-containing protein n=1 Tax=Oceanihabitans sp. IOP_32 TaxID=2529032 RepID=UPI0012939EED|nr:PH domain-containing protein [Oceanihabitans sp. IOP_32]QFZ53502.1 hypothetical protein FEZ18_01110 [Oceanihabitans sp. IOP_32]